MSIQPSNSEEPAITGKVILDEFISLTPIAIKEKQSPQFTLALAHEIRNPLTNINLAIEILQSDPDIEDRNVFLDIIARSSFRINELITNLLHNFEAKEIVLEITNVIPLLDEVLYLIRDRLTLKNILVNKYYTKKECRILINKPQIMIAIINILINAIDAMASTGGELKITTRLIKGTCIIEIEDNGKGISKKNLANIFKPYFTDKPGGVGLGLSTTLTTLLSNHARVKAHSEEGKGTRFVLFFDIIDNNDEQLKNIPLVKYGL